MIGGIDFLITAFKTNILWGLICLFISPLSLIFLVLYWNDVKNSFFLQIIGIIIIFIGVINGGHL
ncbi:hypothetical protein F4V57_13615 [Acinetobacter qingfengensis]|nr:hypothetical protein F4V57_13615 [Acinetobacter qingfengensis]